MIFISSIIITRYPTRMSSSNCHTSQCPHISSWNCRILFPGSKLHTSRGRCRRAYLIDIQCRLLSPKMVYFMDILPFFLMIMRDRPPLSSNCHNCPVVKPRLLPRHLSRTMLVHMRGLFHRSRCRLDNQLHTYWWSRRSIGQLRS